VQLGEHDLERRAALVLGVDGDAPTVVGDLDRAVAVEGDLDAVRVAAGGLVDGVVDELPQQVRQAVGAGAADVHAGALADRLEALEHLDVRGVVAGGLGLAVLGHQNLRVPAARMRSSVLPCSGCRGGWG
jgi:hypothetical protein